jgi:hypothetical protein
MVGDTTQLWLLITKKYNEVYVGQNIRQGELSRWRPKSPFG